MKPSISLIFMLISIQLASQLSNYQPLEPLPVITINLDSNKPINNKSILERLPDETTRLVSKEYSNSQNAKFQTFVSIEKKGNYYTVLFDWIKYNASIALAIDENNTSKLLVEPSENLALKKSDMKTKVDDTLRSLYINQSTRSKINIVKVIIGVGIRVKATIKSKKRKLTITDLFGLGASAEDNKIEGALDIQAMGITGKAVTSLIPLPIELNKSSIQSLLTNIAAIREKIYTLENATDDKFFNVQITPRIIGYEDLSGKNYTLNQIQSFIYRATPYILVNQGDGVQEGI